MPGGRPTTGLELINGLEGSNGAKARLRAALETMMGLKSIAQASEEVGLKEAMLHVERTQALQGALAALEPKPLGRPRKLEVADPRELGRLRAQNAELQEEIRKLRVKADYHQALDSLREKEKAAEKKTKSRAQKR
jgi:transposase-like protein